MSADAKQIYDISDLNILALEKDILISKQLTGVFREFGVPSVSPARSILLCRGKFS
jgi:hypothetical protein